MMGKRVKHPFYDLGTVIDVRDNGLKLLVDFDSYRKPIWVSMFEVEVIVTEADDVEEDHSALVPPSPRHFIDYVDVTEVKRDDETSDLPMDVFNARMAIEALRLGVISGKLLRKLTVDRRDELEQFNELVITRNRGILIVGDYGSGKTHFLELIRAEYLNKGWAVSKINIDSEETPFHKPKSIYQAILKNFQFRHPKLAHEMIGDFKDFLDLLFEFSKGFDHYDEFEKLELNLFFGPILQISDFKTTSQELWEYITGEMTKTDLKDFDSYFKKIPLLSTFDYSTAACIYSYVISSIGWICKHIFGLKGFLILIDEAEGIEQFYWYRKDHNELGMNFLKGLSLMTAESKVLTTEKIYRNIGEGRYKGKKTDLIYCGALRKEELINSLRYIWRRDSNVRLALGITYSERLLDAYNPFVSMHKIKLSTIPFKDYLILLRNILDIYKLAHSEDKKELDLNAIEKFLESTYEVKNFVEHYEYRPRQIIKAFVEICDLCSLYPNSDLFEELKLK